MTKLLKFLFWTLAIGAGLVLGIGVGLTLWFDGERAGARIGDYLSSRLGQPVSLGAVSLHWSPLPGVRVSELRVGEPAMAEASVVDLQLRLAPLLERRLHLAEVAVDGLVLDLDAAPVPVAAEGETPSESSGGDHGGGRVPLRVDVLRLRNASIRLGGEKPLRLENLQLSAAPLSLDEAISVELDTLLAGSVQGLLKARGGLTVSGDGSLHLQDTRLELGEGSLPVAMALSLELRSDPAIGEVSVPAFTLDTSEASIAGKLTLTDLNTEPRLSAELASQVFSARALLTQAGITQPEDPTALTRVQLAATVSGTAGDLRVVPTVRVDDSRLTGSLSLSAGPSIAMDLEIDRLNLDRYRSSETVATSPATPGGVVAGASAGDADQSLLATDLAINGEIRVGALTGAGVEMTALRVPLSLSEGVLQLQPTARLYEGEYRGDIRLEGPRLYLNEQLRGVNTEALLQALSGQARISGRGDLDAHLSLVPGEADAMKRSLHGTLRLSFRDGRYQGVNLARLLRGAQALLAGRPPPPEDDHRGTDFTELSASFDLADGRATNDDLYGASPFLRVRGQGGADLISRDLDYRLSAVLVRTPEGQGGAGLEQLEGLAVPVRVTGKLGEPRFALDSEALIREHGESLLEEQLEDLGGELQKELEDRLGEKLEKEAGKLLKGLFQ